MKSIWMCFIVLILLQESREAVKMLLISKNYMEACEPKPGEIPIGDVIDFSGLKYTELADGTIVRNGFIKFKMGIPDQQIIKSSTSMYDKIKGIFVPVPYVFITKNLCGEIFDPKMHIYELTRHVAAAGRDCPPKAGTIYHIENLTKYLDFKDLTANSIGDVKAVVKFVAGTIKTCAQSTFKLL